MSSRREDVEANILTIAAPTLLVSKLDKSKLVKFHVLLNMPFISVTLLVSKLETSRLVKLDAPLNMPLMLVTLLVSKLETFMCVKSRVL